MANGAPLAGQPLAGQALSAPPAGAPIDALKLLRERLSKRVAEEGDDVGFLASMRALGGVDPLESTKELATLESNQQQLQLKNLAAGVESLSKFAELDPETQQALMPAFKPFTMAAFKAAGADLPENVFEAVATIPGAANLLNDPIFSDEEKVGFRRLIPRDKGKALDAILKIKGEKSGQVVDQILQALPGVIPQIHQERGIPTDQPIPVSVLTEYAQQSPDFQRSPLVRQAWGDLISGKAPQSKQLASFGILSPETAQKRQEALLVPQKPEDAGKMIAQSVEDRLIPFLGQTALGKGKDAVGLLGIIQGPQRGQLLTDAKALADAASAKLQADILSGKAIAESQMSLTLPFMTSDFHLNKNMSLIDTRNAQDVSANKDLTAQHATTPGTPYVILNKDDKKKLDENVSLDPTVSLLKRAAEDLATQPYENLPKGMELWWKSKVAGDVNVQTFIQKNEPLVLKMASALQGGGRLSDQDIINMRRAFINIFESKKQALAGIRLIEIIQMTERSRLYRKPSLSDIELKAMTETVFGTPAQATAPTKPKGRYR